MTAMQQPSEDFVSGNDRRWQTFVLAAEDMLGVALRDAELDRARDAFAEGACVVEYVLGVQASRVEA